MKWRIATNGVALVVAISSVAVVASASSSTLSESAPQRFVANDAKTILSTIKLKMNTRLDIAAVCSLTGQI